MKQIYRESFTIRASEVGAGGVIRTDAIGNLLQETAGNHANELNFDIRDLQENSVTWILHQLHLKMESYPNWRETITVETWPSSGDRLRAYRDFRILDQQDRELGVALSYWIIMDLKNRRPRRIPQKILDMGLEGAEHVLPLTDDSFNLNVNGETGKTFTVLRTDVDLNQHANNVAYIRWILEAVPENFYLHNKCRELNLQYKAEAQLNDEILSAIERVSEQEFYHEIRRGNKTIAKGKSIWS